MQEVYRLRAEIIAKLVEEGYGFPLIAVVMNLTASDCKCYYKEFLSSTWTSSSNQ